MNRLKLTCPDFTFPLMPHDKALDLIATLGFKGADIGLFERRSHLQPSSEFRRVGRSARNLKRKLDDRGLRATDIFMLLDPDPFVYSVNQPLRSRRRKAREGFLKQLDYADASGCRHVTGLPGLPFGLERPSEAFNRSVDELPWYVEQAKSRRIAFGVEPHFGSVISTPKKALELANRVPGLTYTLDYGHFTMHGHSDAAVQPLVKHASHFHLRGARKNRLQTSFKENSIDFKRVMKAFDKRGYRGWICIEYVWMEAMGCNRCDNISETILFRDFLRSLS